ncbi:MAG: hypothetical protein K1060chlam1_01470 [Candidatus Anoxychlamydiales bacterium]|nr:hypothetical protein [Candidatus Anoxychlamydiales bacterium]
MKVLIKFFLSLSILFSSTAFSNESLLINQNLSKQTQEKKTDILTCCKFLFSLLSYENINLLYTTYYQLQHYMEPNKYNLNPENISSTKNKIAKIILIIPGQGGNEAQYYYFLKQLQKTLNQEDMDINVFSVKDCYSPEDPIPTYALEERINEIAQILFNAGYEEIYFTLIGHSLGGIRAFDFIVSNPILDPKIKISQIITFASRLFYKPYKDYDDLMCGDQKDSINNNYEKFQEYRSNLTLQQKLNEVRVHTLAPDNNDWLFPSECGQLPEKARLEDEVHEIFPGTYHLSIIFSDEAIKKAITIIQNWLND